MLKVLRSVKAWGKTPYKKTQLNTLITFDRVMLLNLKHGKVCQKTSTDISIFYQNFWRAKNEKINFVIFGALFWGKYLYSLKPEFMLKIFLLSFRILTQNWNILFISKVTAILKNVLFLLILSFLLTSAW